MTTPPPALLVLAALVASGCGGPGEDTAAACTSDETLVNWENWGAGFFAGYCRTCHSADTTQRYGAPAGLDFDTEAQVRDWRDGIARSVLEDATMPVGGGLPDAELPQLELFLRCGL